jgi:hypothetical protein
MTEEERHDRPMVERIVRCLNDYAENNGCRGEHDGICLEVSPDVPAHWCQYCLMGESAKAFDQLRAEVAALREQLQHHQRPSSSAVDPD